MEINMNEQLEIALNDCELFTIDSNNSIKRFSEVENKIFKNARKCLEKATQYKKNRRTITFRGFTDAHQSNRLNGFELSKLFYFGDKAQSYYKTDENILTKQYLSCIEDCSPKTLDYIFNEIKNLLQENSLRYFSGNNPEFVNFFQDSNKPNFFSYSPSLREKIRDYYLYLLHTAGDSVVKSKSFLVSTSLEHKMAEEYSDDEYVIIYIVPAPLCTFAVTHKFALSYETELEKNGFPLYKGAAIHPEENEIAIKGALFPNHILGIKDMKNKKFIVNPHIFEKPNTPSSIVRKGLIFNQSDISNRLEETNYHSGVFIYKGILFGTLPKKSILGHWLEN